MWKSTAELLHADSLVWKVQVLVRITWTTGWDLLMPRWAYSDENYQWRSTRNVWELHKESIDHRVLAWKAACANRPDSLPSLWVTKVSSQSCRSLFTGAHLRGHQDSSVLHLPLSSMCLELSGSECGSICPWSSLLLCLFMEEFTGSVPATTGCTTSHSGSDAKRRTDILGRKFESLGWLVLSTGTVFVYFLCKGSKVHSDLMLQLLKLTLLMFRSFFSTPALYIDDLHMFVWNGEFTFCPWQTKWKVEHGTHPSFAPLSS